MTYVKMKTEDWVLQLRDKLYQLFDPDEEPGVELCPHAQLLEPYLEWAEKHYDEKTVPSPDDLADWYYNDSEAMDRDEENADRDNSMSDSEWQDYCKSKDAIIVTDEYALITDGYCHREEQL
jgi:hypothetical protein